MKANEVRQKYLKFMEARGYNIVPAVNLIPENDPTTLFTGSGMQPMVPYLLGETHPIGELLTDSQPCLRSQDIDEIGDNRHTTFFEMLGDWSLNGFSKKQHIEWLFEFLTEELGLDPTKLYVTCFIGDEKNNIPRDNETAEAWQKVFEKHGIEAKTAEIGSAEHGDERGIKPGERIFFYDDKENWWSRNGGIATTPIGDPCGPDNEVFYDFGESAHDASFGKAHPASDSGRFMEICNKVWMQYKRLEDGGFEPLAQGKVDFGGGLSRLAAASLDTPDIFKTDLYSPIIAQIEELSAKEYDSNKASMRVIADHLTGAVWLTSQGLIPSNKEQGYVLRRMVRRAILKALNLGMEENFIEQIIQTIIEIYAESYPDLPKNREQIITILQKEETAFRRTLSRGLREMEKLKNEGLTGKELFKLQDTYGFPLELAVEEAYRQDIKLSKNWREEFSQELAEQRQRSQTATRGKFKGGLEDHSEMSTKYHTATHLLLAALQKQVDPKIVQKGSNITADRLRLDFNFDQKLSAEEIAKVEAQVNEWIQAGLNVSHDEYDKDFAKNTLKAQGQFWERYPDRVTVYMIGEESAPASVEICGGPHVKNTKELMANGAKFKIKKEQASSAGVRRIKAVLE